MMARFFARLALVVSLLALVSSVNAAYIVQSFDSPNVVAGSYVIGTSRRDMSELEKDMMMEAIKAGMGMSKRDVWSPKIVEPTDKTVWVIGQEATVMWSSRDATHPPEHITNKKGKIVLGRLGPDGTGEHLDLEHPLVADFDILMGSARFKVPDVKPGGRYIVVLFGDSGNRSQPFTIQRPQA
ncbi:hypothetical protein NLI96_g6414 [Meripilus lineatus]|uniref:Uncharacterized protein n=1 Tax=Meripilus lineatus TaxID=2056292 RepID=A0AAD5V2V7_9APHY|nr:hypothetical protein NLI96_g6414 [Physisporinus lineatus]